MMNEGTNNGKGRDAMKILTHKVTGEVRVIGAYGTTARFATRELALKDYKRLQNNSIKRKRNQILRDLCGTSAAAAKRDMGL